MNTETYVIEYLYSFWVTSGDPPVSSLDIGLGVIKQGMTADDVQLLGERILNDAWDNGVTLDDHPDEWIRLVLLGIDTNSGEYHDQLVC